MVYLQLKLNKKISVKINITSNSWTNSSKSMDVESTIAKHFKFPTSIEGNDIYLLTSDEISLNTNDYSSEEKLIIEMLSGNPEFHLGVKNTESNFHPLFKELKLLFDEWFQFDVNFIDTSSGIDVWYDVQVNDDGSLIYTKEED